MKRILRYISGSLPAGRFTCFTKASEIEYIMWNHIIARYKRITFYTLYKSVATCRVNKVNSKHCNWYEFHKGQLCKCSNLPKMASQISFQRFQSQRTSSNWAIMTFSRFMLVSNSHLTILRLQMDSASTIHHIVNL